MNEKAELVNELANDVENLFALTNNLQRKQTEIENTIFLSNNLVHSACNIILNSKIKFDLIIQGKIHKYDVLGSEIIEYFGPHFIFGQKEASFKRLVKLFMSEKIHPGKAQLLCHPFNYIKFFLVVFDIIDEKRLLESGIYYMSEFGRSIARCHFAGIDLESKYGCTKDVDVNRIKRPAEDLDDEIPF